MALEWSFAVYLLAVVPAVTCNLVVYPAADGAPSSDKFQKATLRIILEQSLEWNLPLYVIFIDYEKAFDSVDRQTLWKLLRHYGVPEKITNIIRKSYEKMICRIVNGRHLTDAFEVNTGIYLTQDGQRQQSHVYITTSDHRAAEISSVKGGRSMSWTSFAFTGGKVTVEVHTSRDFQHCIVRPKSYGYSCHRTDTKTATFDVTGTAKMMSVEFDYDYGSESGGTDIADKLMVFADPPEAGQPSKTDSSVLYYDVGVHNLNGQLAVDSHVREVYLAPGAWVKGGFKSTAVSGLKIHGRGVLDNRDYKWRDSRFSGAVISLDAGSRHVVEGITISDPCCDSVRAHSTMNTVNSVKVVGGWIHGNGSVSVGLDGVVEKSFIHANSDAIMLYAGNLRVTQCVVWQAQTGAVLQTGGSESHTVHNVQVDNIDVIHTDWCTFKGASCSLSDHDAIFNNAGDARTIDVATMNLRNVRVEGSCPRVFYWKVEPGATASLRNIIFSNWSIERQPAQDNIHNEFAGTASTGHVSSLEFIDLLIGGRCVANLAEADFVIDTRTTTNVIFRCSGALVG